MEDKIIIICRTELFSQISGITSFSCLESKKLVTNFVNPLFLDFLKGQNLLKHRHQIAPSGCWGHCIKQSYRAQGLIVRGIRRRQRELQQTERTRIRPPSQAAERIV